jgi:hypothetical protein
MASILDVLKRLKQRLFSRPAGAIPQPEDSKTSTSDSPSPAATNTVASAPETELASVSSLPSPPPCEPLPTAQDAERWDEDETAIQEEDEDEAEPELATALGIIDRGLEPARDPALEVRRQESRSVAMAGEHSIYLSDSAGPGSLAEALNRLLQEARVTVVYGEDDDQRPYLRYWPIREAS